MKKVLLGTSAVALASAFVSPAAATEWEVRVGGYMEQFVAYASSDVEGSSGEFDGIDAKQDAEIFFLPSITLDNGIKIGVNIQLEGAGYLGTSDTIDESYMFIRGSFGEVNLGSENSAGYKMHYAAPDVTFLNVNSGSTTAFIPWSGGSAGADVFRGTLGSTYIENERNNDAQRFTYYTPRFAGFQVGVSYARDGRQDNNAQVDTDAELSDIFDIGANYVNSFGDFNVALSGRWGTASVKGGPDPDIWSAGLNLGYAGFTIGGSYADQNDAGTENGHAYDVGISYETGPWGFSFTYFHGENNGDGDGDGIFLLDATDGSISDTVVAEIGKEEVDQYLLGVSYSLAKGVDLNAYGAYVDFKDANGGVTVQDVDGWIVGTGIKVSF